MHHRVPSVLWNKLSTTFLRICLQCRRPQFDSWIEKIPEESPWTEEKPGQHSPWDHKKLDMTEGLSTNLASVLSFILFCFSNPLVPFSRQIYSLHYYSVPIPMLASQVAQFSSVQSLRHVQLFATPWTEAHQVSLSITNFWSLLTLMSIESVMPSNHLILCCPLLLQSFPALGSFPVSQFFASGGLSIGASVFAPILTMNIQD